MDTTIQSAEQALSGSLSTTQTLKQYVRLTKPRIALLIVISTAVGYCYGIGSTFHVITFLHALVGTTLLACGAATLNQWWERTWDAQMNRTKNRPIPAGLVTARDALLFGLVLTAVGTAELWIFCNILAAGLGILTSVGYVLAYTPLKRKHPVCTTVGALPGAMPPLIGFAAASSHLGIDAWVLFSILFLWQFPHFHAIAWMYREDYERGGVKMLAVARPFGVGLTIEILSALLLLVPITLAPTLLHMAGHVYFVAAVLLDAVFVYFGWQLARERNRKRARGLLLASVLYLPVLFAFLVFDNLRFLS
ncbi:MAG TPA: heme o synthase [Bryobacteraceae bacterium]|nr:heme o synthase [Bryobacteraceae bacterium]